MTRATSVPILVFLGLSVLDLGPMYTTDRQTNVRQHHLLMPRQLGEGHNNVVFGVPQLPLIFFYEFQISDFGPSLGYG